jgi:hypothetical protein
MTVIGVHLLMLLQAQGLALAVAVALGAGRPGAGRRAHPRDDLRQEGAPDLEPGRVLGLVAVGLGLLVAAPDAAAACIVLYGMGSGIRSIAHGTVPLAMFDREGYATLMGRLGLPMLLATAAARRSEHGCWNGSGRTDRRSSCSGRRCCTSRSCCPSCRWRSEVQGGRKCEPSVLTPHGMVWPKAD